MLGIRSYKYVNATLLTKMCNSVLVKSRVAGICNGRRSGKREIVGFGLNGVYMYFDRTDCPFPAIRFRESTPEILALKEKERGDWRRLTLEEKKTLYRASFCQTYAELDAPTGEWKSIMGMTMLLVSCSLWLWLYIHTFVHTEAPKSFSEESRAAQYWRQEAINNQPFSGNYKPPNADKYKPVDYEVDQQKRN